MKKNPTPFERLLRVMTNPWMAISYSVLVILSFFYLDQPIAYYFHAIDLKHNFSILNWFTHLGSNTLWIALLFLLALFFRYIKRNKTYEMRMWFLWVCVLLPNMICTLLKITLGRARPELLFSDHMYGFYGLQTQKLFWSLPSGHTSTVTGLVFGLMVLFPRYTYAFILAGCALIGSRIVLTHHFLSDVLVAAYLTLLEIGVIVWWLYRKQYLKKGSDGTVNINHRLANAG